MVRQIAVTADVSVDAVVGEGSQIGTSPKCVSTPCSVRTASWDAARTSDPECGVGANSKIQNYALVYEPAELGEGTFIGPAAVLTNDQYPRAVNPDGTRKDGHDWEPVGVTVLEGASIGAKAVCIAPVTIGSWSMVAAGSTVTRDVQAFALVAGSPSRAEIGWVGRAGVDLNRSKTALTSGSVHSLVASTAASTKQHLRRFNDGGNSGCKATSGGRGESGGRRCSRFRRPGPGSRGGGLRV